MRARVLALTLTLTLTLALTRGCRRCGSKEARLGRARAAPWWCLGRGAAEARPWWCLGLPAPPATLLGCALVAGRRV